MAALQRERGASAQSSFREKAPFFAKTGSINSAYGKGGWGSGGAVRPLRIYPSYSAPPFSCENWVYKFGPWKGGLGAGGSSPPPPHLPLLLGPLSFSLSVSAPSLPTLRLRPLRIYPSDAVLYYM
jgi:hypothetical protein